MMHMLTCNCSGSTLTVPSTLDHSLILESSLLSSKVPFCNISIAMVKLAVLDTAKLSTVLFWENFTVLNRLDGAVVVILVNFLVDGSVDLFVLVRFYDLLLHSRCYSLVDGGVVVTGLAHEIANCCLSFVHGDTSVVCLD